MVTTEMKPVHISQVQIPPSSSSSDMSNVQTQKHHQQLNHRGQGRYKIPSEAEELLLRSCYLGTSFRSCLSSALRSTCLNAGPRGKGLSLVRSSEKYGHRTIRKVFATSNERPTTSIGWQKERTVSPLQSYLVLAMRWPRLGKFIQLPLTSVPRLT